MSQLRPGVGVTTRQGLGKPVGGAVSEARWRIRLDWIRWTMRTGPLVNALIEHLVGAPGRYALESGFHVVVEGAVLARADPRARGWAATG